MVKRKNLMSQLRDKTLPELKKQLTDVRLDSAKILVEMNAGRIKNVSLYGQKKKEAAKILTILKEKELKKA